MKVASIVGARPNFIKQAMVASALAGKQHHEILIHTGQHYDFELDRIFFEQLDIRDPDVNLEVGSGTHAEQTGQMMAKTEKALLDLSLDWVIVYGDTNSTLAGALAAVKLNLPVAHVEAGPRGFNREMPEEINRVVVDHLSSLLFAPSEQAADNLRREGLVSGVHKTGDVMYDAVLRYKGVAEERSDILSRLRLEPKSFLLATVHRAGTTDDPEKLTGIMQALHDVSEQVVFPLHPRTRAALAALESPLETENITFIDPVGYLDMLKLIANARLVVTDSGGLQKEAYFLKTPCVTCLDEDAWPETTTAGANRLAGTDAVRIVDAIRKPFPPIKETGEFGDGHAAEKIVKLLETKRRTND